MSRLSKNISLLAVVWLLLTSCLAMTGCGKGAYDTKLDTAVQNAKSGVAKADAPADEGEMGDAALMAKYAIDDEEPEDEDDDYEEFEDEDEEPEDETPEDEDDPFEPADDE